MENEEESRDQNCGPEVTLTEAMDLTEPERWMWMLTAWLPSLPASQLHEAFTRLLSLDRAILVPFPSV